MLRSITALACVAAKPAEDKFESLPFGNDVISMPTESYSGYINATDTKQLHYVFVESQNTPATDPVLIWFNGGPGCSSMLGFMQENGPVVYDDDTNELSLNEQSWNQNANVLYIESPAGVGYSLALTEADMVHSDNSTSEDAYAALNEWYIKFPEYVNNSLWISGESYGGIYVPYLANEILKNNKKIDEEEIDALKINLAGILVGNGATSWDYDNSPSIPQTAVGMGLIPQALLDEWNTNGCIFYFRDVKPSGGVDCQPIWDKFSASIDALNIYDFFRTQEIKFPSVEAEERIATAMVGGEEKTYKRGMTQAEYTPWLKHLVNDRDLMYAGLADYLNDEKVREALNIPQSAPGWSECSGEVGGKYILQTEASLWIYPILKENNIKMLFYSGETDGAIPTYGTKEWIKDLAWPVTSPWTAWMGDNQQNYGWTTTYADIFTFTIVRGVGHMAPQWARQPVLDMVNDFISSKAEDVSKYYIA